MVVIETMFIDGEPVGKVCEDLGRGLVTFIPKDGNKRLARRKWKSVVSCQRAVIKTYTKESPQ